MAGKKQRQRQLERARYQRRQVRMVQRDRQARKWTISVLAAIAVLAVAVGVFFLVRPSGKSAAATTPPRHCVYTASPPATRNVGKPPATVAYKASSQATIHTNRGNIVINLLNSKAPCTVNSFAYLASKNYFSSTPCHRLSTVSPYVLQCGDPSGRGSGGPGYKFADENLAGAKYTAGTVAMANSGPGTGTNGSQFFLVYKNSLSLPASYTPFGTIVSGLNIIQKVAQAGSDNSTATGDGHPKDKVDIESVTIKN